MQMELGKTAIGPRDRGRDEFIAARLVERPAGEDLMEAICERENRREVLMRVVRYADDVAIYVRTAKAAERVKRSVSRFITRRLKLVIVGNTRKGGD